MADLQWIPLVPVAELPDDLQVMARKWADIEDGDAGFIRTVAHVPDTLRSYIRWSSPMWRKGLVQHRTKELCRIRIANSNECRYCMTMRYESGRQQGIDDQLVDQLVDFEHGEFSEREKAALRFTDEVYLDDITWDYERVAPSVWNRMTTVFSEPEIVEVTWAICIATEYGRNFTSWGVPVAGKAPDLSSAGSDATPRPDVSLSEADTNRVRLELSEVLRDEPRDAPALTTLLTKPEMLDRVLVWYRHIIYGGLLEAPLRRAVREKVFQLADGVLDGSVAADADTPRTRAALRFVHAMATDYRTLIDDEQTHTLLRAHFDTAEMVELGMLSGACLTFRRVGGALGSRIRPELRGMEPVG